jgi:5'-3' exonuclease
MGIPALAPIFGKLAGVRLAKWTDVKATDVYVDLNGFVYAALAETGPQTIGPACIPTARTPEQAATDVAEYLCKFVDEILSEQPDCARLTLVLDGPAGLSKLPLQVARRWAASGTAAPPTLAYMLPGSAFLEALDAALVKAFQTRVFFRATTLTFSGSLLPFEGEAKLFQLMNNYVNTISKEDLATRRIAVLTVDSDLLLWTLLFSTRTGIQVSNTAGCLSFGPMAQCVGPMAQCVVHALKGLACRARVSLQLARRPRTASSAQRSRRLRSTLGYASPSRAR